MVDTLKKFSSRQDAILAAKMLADQAERIFIEDISPEDAFGEAQYIIDYADRFMDNSMAQQVMDILNQTFGTHFTHLGKITALIKQRPKTTVDQCRSVIQHKWETWGNDEYMKAYLRPATLFGSVNKFNNYLDDATNYWMTKLKQTNNYEQH